MLRALTLAFCSLMLLGSGKAFAPPSVASGRAPSALLMSNSAEGEKRTAASFLAAAYLLANVVSIAPAVAFPADFAGSSEIIAARSGGRMGGRSSVGSRSSSASYSRPTVSHTTIVRPATVIQTAPSYGYSYGYAYDPVPGIALNLGLSAMNSVGNGIREYRQEEEIARERVELEQARIKQAELEARLRQLEARP